MGEMNILDKLASHLAQRQIQHTAISNQRLSRENQQDHADSAMTQQPENAQGALGCSSQKTEEANHPSTTHESVCRSTQYEGVGLP